MDDLRELPSGWEGFDASGFGSAHRLAALEIGGPIEKKFVCLRSKVDSLAKLFGVTTRGPEHASPSLFKRLPPIRVKMRTGDFQGIAKQHIQTTGFQ